MSTTESLTRYNLIIKKVRRNPATLKEIEDYLKFESEIQGYNFITSKRTFQRDLNAIRSIFNIDILFNFSRKVYYIDTDQQPEVNKRVLEAFDTFNALNISERLSDFIHFEKRQSKGTEHLYGILNAIRKQFQISFTYQKYWEDKTDTRMVEPYVLKEFKNRWYVLANDLEDETVKTFALDRITGFEIAKRKFQVPNNFNISEYFKNCFGIMGPNENQPEDIILSLDPVQGKYIKSLPLHESQEILIDTEDELRIKVTLYITHDFYMELLSMGENVKIIQPKTLIKKIKITYSNCLSLY
jgi:predicted DNA-binding transcriptional regulator YafY